MKKLIIGVGNTLMQDEGIGVYFLNYIRNDFPDFEIKNLGNLSLSLMPELENRKCVIFIDAINENYSEDYIFFELKKDNIPLKFSLHEISIRELIGICRFTGKEPERIFVFGIKPYSLNPHIGLSKKMKEKLPFLQKVFKEFLLKFSIM